MPARRLPHLPRWLAAFGFVVLSAISCWVLRAPLLSGAAHWWIVDGPLAKADAIVVLGGGVPQRAMAAARLYHDGWAPQILVTDAAGGAPVHPDLLPTEASLSRTVLRAEDVPDAAIVSVGQALRSTYDEALAVRDWVRSSGARSVIIATDDFHTRRASWIFRKVLTPTGAQVQTAPAANPTYNSTQWWRSEGGLVMFQNEVIKYLYYRVRHWEAKAEN